MIKHDNGKSPCLCTTCANDHDQIGNRGETGYVPPCCIEHFGSDVRNCPVMYGKCPDYKKEEI